MLSLPQTAIDPNLFLYLPPQGRRVDSDSNENGNISDPVPSIAFFITGNPGLISYYYEFLQLLISESSPPHGSTNVTDSDNQRENDPRKSPSLISRSCVVAGFSLGGFDLPPVDKPQVAPAAMSDNGSHTPSLGLEQLRTLLTYPSGFERKEIYGLRDQIELCYARLTALVAWVRDTYGSPSVPALNPTSSKSTSMSTSDTQSQPSRTVKPINVILLGHSVGAYIALELVQKHSRSQTHSSSADKTARQFTIPTAILLTPTILNIAHSSTGQLATPLLRTFPVLLPSLAQLGAHALPYLLPTKELRARLVGAVTGMSRSSAGLDATVAFLGSDRGVRQALCLAREEMLEIGPNRWGREVWGAAAATTKTNVFHDDDDDDDEGEDGMSRGDDEAVQAPRLVFWFARADHWVADVTREEILAIVRESDGSAETKSVVVVDGEEEDGLVHAWCLRQSARVADRVRGWMEQVLLR